MCEALGAFGEAGLRVRGSEVLYPAPLVSASGTFLVFTEARVEARSEQGTGQKLWPPQRIPHPTDGLTTHQPLRGRPAGLRSLAAGLSDFREPGLEKPATRTPPPYLTLPLSWDPLI